MRTFLAANLGLAPFAAFWILLGVVGILPATIIGLALAAGVYALARPDARVPHPRGGRGRAVRFSCGRPAFRLGRICPRRRRFFVRRPRRAGALERGVRTTLDRRIFARRLCGGGGEPDLPSRESDIVGVLGRVVPRRRCGVPSRVARLSDDGPLRVRRAGLGVWPQTAHSPHGAAVDSSRRRVPLGGAKIRHGRRSRRSDRRGWNRRPHRGGLACRRRAKSRGLRSPCRRRRFLPQFSAQGTL